MKRTSAFLELAERISEDIHNEYWRVCLQLQEENNLFFTEHFKPNKKELRKYKHHHGAWLQTSKTTTINDNQFRILCLLLAHEIWCDTIDKD